jgi:tryptophan synthase beta subunit
VRACAAFTFAIVGKSAWIKKPNEISVVNLSGRGDKDLATYQEKLKLNS